MTLFIIFSSIALALVLVIQVNWIIQTARMKEVLFNEKANMALARAAVAVSEDQQACRQMGENLHLDSTSELAAKLGNEEAEKIDRLLKYYLNYYNLHLDYSFKVIKPGPIGGAHESNFSGFFLPPQQPGSFEKSLTDIASENGLELKLIFPNKRQFIMAEMGTMFIASVLLILVVMVLFWRTILSLWKEKQLSEHTADFLNNMTHEFRTPLANIALAGKMMRKEGAVLGEEKSRHYTGIILEENEKLRLQVEQVLSMTALERGEIPLQMQALDLHRLIMDALKSFRIQLEHLQGSLTLHLDADRFVVKGDKVHLYHALCNLIDNAIKYSRGKPVIGIETFCAGGKLVMRISDQGIGIAKEHQQKVFAKFFRVPTGDVHDVKGFGLGLAYVRKMVELHGGTMELESEKNRGTTFTITLPNA